MATGMLCNSDCKRIEKLIKDLHEQYSRGVDQYPKNIENAHNMLVVHSTTVKPVKETKAAASLYQKGQGKPKEATQKERACYVCGAKDHVAPECPRRWDNKEKWAVPARFQKYPPANGANMNQVGEPTPSVATTQVTVYHFKLECRKYQLWERSQCRRHCRCRWALS